MDKEEIQTNGSKDRKLMTMDEALHPRDDVSGKEGFASIEDCVESSLQGHKGYIEKRKEKLITAANNRIGIISTIRKPIETKKQKWEENNCMDISSYKLAR